MKFIKNKFFCLILFLLGIMQVMAVPKPPSPTGKIPPPPPGLPIDDGLLLVIFIALTYGVYIIYNNTQNQKRHS